MMQTDRLYNGTFGDINLHFFALIRVPYRRIQANFYVLLTVNLIIILDNGQLDTNLLCFTIRFL